MRLLNEQGGLRTFALIAAVMVVAMVAGGCQRETTSPQATDAVGAFLKQQQLTGRVALVQFGSVGCEISGEGYLRMVRMEKDKTIPRLSYLRVDAGSNTERAEAYFKQNPAGFAVARDADGTVAKAFGAAVVPTVALVDKFGRVRYLGAFPDEKQLGAWVATLEEQKEDAGPGAKRFGVDTADTSAALGQTELPDYQDAVKPLGSFMGAKGLLVVFADVRCPYAGQALGELPKVAPKMAELGVATVVVNIGDSAESVHKTYAERSTGTPVLYDITDVTKKRWKIESVPTVVLMGTDGKQAYRGGAVWKDLASEVESALGLEQGSVKFDAEGTEFG